VAAAAGQLGVPAIIVMPADAPRIKIENTRALGAEVRLYDRYREDREAIARAIAQDKGYLVVPPYDDPAIIAGQGTIGLEIAEDCAKLGIAPDVVLAPCSGGGLISGIATAVTARHPQARVFACEPARFDDTRRSLAAGRRLENEGSEKSICDALLSKLPGEITFAINRRLLAGGLTATDEEALAAVAFAARRLKLVVEPGGAVALAAALQGRAPKPAQNIVIVCSGGNIDDELLRKALAA
jgi:threonine dehydratase